MTLVVSPPEVFVKVGLLKAYMQEYGMPDRCNDCMEAHKDVVLAMQVRTWVRWLFLLPIALVWLQYYVSAAVAAATLLAVYGLARVMLPLHMQHFRQPLFPGGTLHVHVYVPGREIWPPVAEHEAYLVIDHWQGRVVAHGNLPKSTLVTDVMVGDKVSFNTQRTGHRVSTLPQALIALQR